MAKDFEFYAMIKLLEINENICFAHFDIDADGSKKIQISWVCSSKSNGKIIENTALRFFTIYIWILLENDDGGCFFLNFVGVI